MSISIFLFTIGTVCGLYYWYLGILAGGYLKDREKRESLGERLVHAGFGWSIGNGDEFSEEGKRICRRGNWVLVSGIIVWFAWGVLK